MVTQATAKALEAESWGNETREETLERLWNTQLRQFFWEHYSRARSQESKLKTKRRLGSDDETKTDDLG